MRIRYGVILAVIGSIIFFSSMQGWGTDWKVYESNKEGIHFYDAEGVKEISKDIIQVWTKRIFPPEKVLIFVEKFGLRYQELDHAIRLVEIDCTKGKLKPLQVTYYKKDNSIIDHVNFEALGVQWYPITPQTAGSSLLNTICEKYGTGMR